MKKSGNPSLVKVCLLAVMFVSYADTYVFALPKGGHAVSGTATFAQDGNLTVITAGNRSIINYQSFNIAPGETVRFVQPNSNASVLNRVTSPNPTNIFGQLQANGNVYIVNPYGVFFQNGAVLNVGGLYAGAGKISDQDFTHGRIKFTDLAGDVRNDGVLAADNRIVLMGANVANNGTMTSTRGLATMVSGREVYVGERNSNVFVRANGAAGKPAAAPAGSVTNTGTVSAPRVLLGAGDLYSTAIVNSGLLKGRDITVNAGRNGTATVGGTLDASRKGPAATGGNIQVLGGKVALRGANLDASGTAGGGNVRLGGDFHGDGTLAHAATTTVDTATAIRADATGARGNGGSVVLWSDQATAFTGNISARAGSAGGDGGTVEVSSKGGLGFNGLVDAGAPAGKPGSMLLDPTNIEISTTSGAITTSGNVPAGSAPSPGTLVISAAALESLTLANTNILLQATNDIRIDSLTGTVLTNPTTGVATAGQLTFAPGTGSITFQAGTSASGSFVMQTATDTIATQGRSITVQASGPTVAGTGINTGDTNAINVGNIVSSPLLPGTAGNITLALASAGTSATVLFNGLTASGVTGGNILVGAPTSAATTPTAVTANGALLAVGTTGNAGNISIYSRGRITLGAVGATSDGATGGAVALLTNRVGQAAGTNGDISVGNIDVSSGANAGTNGGTITIGKTATGGGLPTAVTAGALDTSSSTTTTGSGGNVSIISNGAVSLAGAATDGATGGNIVIGDGAAVATTPTSITSTADLTTTGGAGDSGAVTLTSAGGIGVTGNIDASSGTGNGNDVQLLISTATPGTAVVSVGNINTATAAAGMSSGSITIGKTTASAGAPSSITTGTLATTSPGQAGSVALTSAGAITTGVIDAHSTGLGGGNVTLATFGATQPVAGTADVVVGNIDTSSDTALGGTISIGGPAGTAVVPTSITVAVLDTDGAAAADGPITLNTSGAIRFPATPTTISLTGNTTLIGTSALLGMSATPASFNLDTNANKHNLTLTFTDGVTVGGTVGYAGVVNFTSNGSGGTSIAGDYTTTGSQLYGNAVTLTSSPTLTAGTTITFGSTVNSDGFAGGRALTLAPGTGGAFFNGTVGNSAPLASIASTITAVGGPVTGGTITTIGDQNYGTLTLTVPTTFAITGAGSNFKAASVDGTTGVGNGLTVNTTATGTATLGATGNTGAVLSNVGAAAFTVGTLVLNGTVGTAPTTPGAASLTANTSVQTSLNGSVITTGTQGYKTVVLGAAATLRTTNSAITANSVDTGANTFTIQAGTGNVTLGTTGNTGTVLSGSGTDNFTAGILTLNGTVGTGTATPGAGTFTANTSVRTLLNGGTVTTSGAQQYNTLLLGTTAIFTTTNNSAFTAASVNTAANNFTVSTGTGAATLGAPGNTGTVLSGSGVDIFNVGTLTLNGSANAGSLTANPTSTTTLFNNVTTTGAQSYDALALGDNVVLSGTVFGATSFTGNNHDLTLTFSQSVTISGFFGGVRNLTSNGDGGTILQGTVSTTGFQLFGNAVTLSGDTILSSSNPGGDITFVGTVESDATARSLTINTTGNEIFGGTVGAMNALSGLTTDADLGIPVGGQAQFNMAAGPNGGVNVAGNVKINDAASFGVTGSNAATPSIRTTGSQTYALNGNLLAANTYLLSTGAGLISIGAPTGPASGNFALDNDTANNNHDLTLATTGATVIQGLVGSNQPLGNLTITAGTGTTISGDATLGLGVVKTTGLQNYNAPVTLGNDITFSTAATGAAAATNGAITFSTVPGSDATPRSLTTSTLGGYTIFTAGSVPATALLNNLTTSVNGTTRFGFSTLTTAGFQNYLGAAEASTAALTLTAGSTITFGKALTSTANNLTDLTLTAPGLSTFTSTVGSTGVRLKSVTVTNASSIGGSIFTTGDQTFSGIATLAGDATLDSSNGSILFSAALDAAVATAPALTISLGGMASLVTFNGAVGATRPLGSLVVLPSGAVAIGGAATGTSINTTGVQTYGGTVNASVPVTFVAGGAFTFSGAVAGTGSVTVTAPGINLDGVTVTSAGGQTYNGAVLIGADDTVLTDSAGNITFSSTLNSFTTQRALTVNASVDEIFTGLVGNTRALLSLTTDSIGAPGGGAHFMGTPSAGVAAVRVGLGGVTINDQVFFDAVGSSSTLVPPDLAGVTGINAPTVTSTGSQQYLGTAAAQLQANTVLQGTTLTLPTGGVNGLTLGVNYNLTLDFSGPVTVAGNITGVNGFASVGNGGTTLSGNLTTTGYQFFGNATTLTGVTRNLVSTGGGTIRFNSTLDGPATTLSIDTAGNEEFNGLVGSSPGGALRGLIIDANIAPGGTTIFGMDLTGLPTGTAGVALGVNGLIVNDTVAFNVIGAVPGSLTSVSSGGVQTYNGLATLGQDTVLTNTNGLNITFGSTLNGFANLSANSTGNIVFNGRVGGTTPLASLTLDSDLAFHPGNIVFNVGGSTTMAPSVTTQTDGTATGAQYYGGGVLLSQATVLNSGFILPATTGGSIMFDNTVASNGTPVNLTLFAGAGSTVFAGPSPAFPQGATLNAAGVNLGAAQVTFNGPVGGSTPGSALNILTINHNGTVPMGVTPTIDINNGGFTSTLGQTYNDAVVLSADTVLTDSSTSGINFVLTLDSIDSTPRALTLTATNPGGSVTFGGLVGSLFPLRSLQSTTTAGTNFNMTLPIGVSVAGVRVGVGGVTVTGPAIFGAMGSSLTNILRPTINTSGAITLNGTVTLNQNTSLYSSGTIPGSRDITFGGAVNGTASGNTGLALNTVGDEVFNALAVVGAVNPLLSFTSDALITPGGQTRLLMNVAGAPSGAAGLRVGANGVRIFDGVDFGVVNGSLNNPSVLVFGGGIQLYNRAANVATNTFLVGDASLTAPAGGAYTGGGLITFNQALTSNAATPPNLTIRTGVGPASFLNTVNVRTLDVTGALVNFNAPVSGLNTLLIAPNGGVGTMDAINLSGGSVASSGGQIYRSPVTLGKDTLLSDGSNGNITFNGTLNGPFALTINTGGNTVFNQAVGSLTALASVTTDAPGSTLINGNVTTAPKGTLAGFQNYLDHVFLGGPITLSDTGTGPLGGMITLNQVDSAAGPARPLAINAQTIRLNGAVGAGAALQSLTATGGGTTILNGGSVRTLAFQTYSSLLGTSVFKTTLLDAGTDVRFDSSLDGVAGNANTFLTISAPGQIRFASPVGATFALSGLLINGGVLALDGGGVRTTGAQSYNATVNLGGTTTLESLQSGNITFNGLLEGAYDLTVNTAGLTAFNAKVGSATALANLTTDASGSTQFNMNALGGVNPAGVNVAGLVTINDNVLFNVSNSSVANPSVQTGAAQFYQGTATLTADTVLTAGNNASLTFNSTVNGAFNLTLNTGGLTILSGFVGGTDRLLSLTTDAGGTTQIDGGGVATAAADGTQTYNDAVLLGADASLSSRPDGSAVASGDLTFNSTVDGQFVLTLNSGGQSVFNGLVGNSAALTGLTINSTVNPGAGTQFNMAVGAAAAGVLVDGDVVIFDPVTFNVVGSSLTQPGVLTLSNGTQTYNGAVSLATNTVLVSASGLPTGGVFADGGAIVFGSPVGISSSGGNDLYVRAGVGTLSFGAAIDVNDLDLGGAQVTFGGPITLPGLLSVQPNGGGTGGAIFLGGGGLTTAGAQVFNAAVILGADTVLTSLNTAGDGGNIVFNFTVDGDGVAPRGLTLNSPGDEVFNGIVGGTVALASLTTDSPGNLGGATRFNMNLAGTASGVAGVRVTGAVTVNDMVSFNVAGGTLIPGDHPAVASGGGQKYYGAATLLLDTALFSTGTGTLTFDSTVNGASGLVLTTAGENVFNGIVGGTAALTSLSTSGAATRFNMSLVGLPGAPAGVSVAGALTVTGPTFFNVAGTSAAQPSVLTTGAPAQTYNGAVTLLQDTVLTAGGGGDLVLNSTVDGAQTLALNTSGATVLGGAVGGTTPLVSLTTDSPGTTSLNGAVTTMGFQTYGDIVLLLADAVLTSQNTVGDDGTITFGKTVDGEFALAINTEGITNFNGAVGGDSPLVSLTTDAPGLTFLNGGTVTTTGFQSYGDAVLLGMATTLTSQNTAGDEGAITFGKTVDGGMTLNVNTSGSTLFNGAVGGSSPLVRLTTDAPGRTFLNGGGVTTTGAQTYGDNVQFGAALTLASFNTAGDGGAITFAQMLDGGFALQLNTPGDTVLGGLVGSTAPLLSLTTDAPGRTVLSGGGVTTASTQTYGDTVVLQADAALTSRSTAGDGTIAFLRTVDGGFALNVNTSSNSIFQGAVGGSVPLTSLTTDAPGATLLNGGRVTTTGSQTYGDVVRLGIATTFLNQGAGAVSFGSTLDGTVSVTVDTGGNTLFGGLVGGGSPLLNLTVANGPVTFQGGGVTTTGSQSYVGAALLTADAVLVSQNTGGDGGSISFGQTVNGTFALDINTRGNILFGGFVGGTLALASVTTGAITPGSITFQGGGVTTMGAQTYGDVATLAADTTALTSTAGGGIVFHQTVDGETRNGNELVLDASGFSAFDGSVGSASPLRSLLVTGPLSISGESVTTFLDQHYQSVLSLTPNASAGTRMVSGAGNLRFEQNVTATGGMFASGRRIVAENDITAAGDLELETVNGGANSPLLLLGGRNYVSTTGNVLFNVQPGSTPDVTDGTATIFLTGSGRVLIQGRNFSVGYLQKIFSLGSIDIEVGRGVARVGDIAARNSIKIAAGTVELLSRPAVQSSAGGRPNDGLNFVADNSIDFGGARINFVGTENPTANFITTGGNTTIQRVRGISLFKDPNVDSQFRSVGNFEGNRFATVSNPIQPLGGGSQALDTAAALSGALPDQKPVDVASEITITASQMEELKKLGIHPRLAQKSERRSTGSKRALFAQLVDGQDPENYGRLQPIKGGISRLEPSDYVVVVDRMGEREVSSILKSFETVYGKNKEKAPDIGAAFQTAFTDYTVQKQTADPAGFGPFLEGQKGKYPAVDKATRDFDDLFGHIEHLGLTEKEVLKSEEHIVSDLGVSGVSSSDMVKVINGLRKKLPPEQKAPSTKVPQSVPAANPAPSASSPASPATPAQPEKKKTPPLKTAEQLKKDSPRKSARRTPPVQKNAQHELAGL